jgi:RNA polymerase sigma factor (sigma-70 family)
MDGHSAPLLPPAAAGAHCRTPALTADADPDLPLLERIAHGETRACGLLLERHLTRLHALATRMLGSAADAEEVCQDVFLRAWQQAPRWQPGAARFSTWLHQVALNLCRDRLRGRREGLPLDAVAEAVDEDTPERLHGRADRAAQVRAALQSLPERQREAVLLCHYQGLGNIEAAQVMELSVEALESLLGRGRRALRLALSGNQGEATGVGA